MIHSNASFSGGLAATIHGVSPTMTHDPGQDLSAGSLLHIIVAKLIVRANLLAEAHRDTVAMTHRPGRTLTIKLLPRVSKGRVLFAQADRNATTHRASCDKIHGSRCVLPTVRHVREAILTKLAVLSQRIPANTSRPVSRGKALNLLRLGVGSKAHVGARTSLSLSHSHLRVALVHLSLWTLE